MNKALLLAAPLIVGAAFVTKGKPYPKEDTNCTRTEISFNCVTFLENHDGDTFTVSIPRIPPVFGFKIPVRVAHIDTAELGSADVCEKNSATEAKNRVNTILKNAKKIDLLNVQRDKYFRLLAEVRVNDEFSLGDLLLKEKLAVPYEGETKPLTNWCLFPPNSLKK